MRVLICEFLPSKIKIQFLSHTGRILNVHKPDEARRYCGYKVFFLSLQKVLLDSVTLHNFKSERTGKSKSRCPLRAPDLSYQSTCEHIHLYFVQALKSHMQNHACLLCSDLLLCVPYLENSTSIYPCTQIRTFKSCNVSCFLPLYISNGQFCHFFLFLTRFLYYNHSDLCKMRV